MRAALATQTRCVADQVSQPCQVSHPVEACTAVCDHLRPPGLAGLSVAPPFPFQTALHLCAALAIRHRCDCDRHRPTYGTSHPAEACALTCAHVLLHTPTILCVLDAFSSDQGWFRVLVYSCFDSFQLTGRFGGCSKIGLTAKDPKWSHTIYDVLHPVVASP